MEGYSNTTDSLKTWKNITSCLYNFKHGIHWPSYLMRPYRVMQQWSCENQTINNTRVKHQTSHALKNKFCTRTHGFIVSLSK